MATSYNPQQQLSLVHGPTNAPLWHKTIGAVLEGQVQKYGDRTAVVVPWQNIRISFRDLQIKSEAVARALLATGVQHGDKVAIMAGNRIEYIEVFLAAARIGCPLVVLNNTYTPSELLTALERTSTKVLFLASTIGSRSLASHAETLRSRMTTGKLWSMRRVVLFKALVKTTDHPSFRSYSETFSNGKKITSETLQAAESKVKDNDVVNIQFTSGTTGTPKAAMLTHRNIVNNGHLVGSRMRLTPNDIICCPPPLFHCFGLVMGFLAALTHSSSIVFPSDAFDASLTLDAIAAEQCTTLLGVPTMFIAELSELATKPYKIATLRTGLAAGSMIPAPLLERLNREMGVISVLIAYGMTETSPVTFMVDSNDPEERRRGLGKVMPHTSAKIVDLQGNILPRGSRGELCTSGYALMKGYLDNKVGTKEVMRRDENGVLWMHTGDECIIDNEGYCEITGRIKDLIIRGGENIFPAEIEEHLIRHPLICEASVVGLPDDKYGEVVSCFLRVVEGKRKPGEQEVREWISSKLSWQKLPKWVFWIGDKDVGSDFPKTGSGKHQKHILRELGQTLIRKAQMERARL